MPHASSLASAQVEHAVSALHAPMSAMTEATHTDAVHAAAAIHMDQFSSHIPLLVAAQQGRLEDVNALLQAGANFNAVDADGSTPMMLAALHGHSNVVVALVHAGANIDVQLLMATNDDKVQVASALLRVGLDSNCIADNGDSALGLAALIGNFDMVNALVNAGASLQGNLSAAIRDDNPVLLRALVRAGADVTTIDGTGVSALTQAARLERVAALNHLLKAAVAGDRGDVVLDAIFQEIFLGHAGAVTTFLRAGIGADLATEQGFTLLMRAAECGHADIVNLLLAAGADRALVADAGGTAMMYAIVNDRIAAIQALAQAGEDVGIHLITAATVGDAAGVTTMLNAGTDVDVVTVSGVSALMFAALAGSVAVTKKLLQAGANVDISEPNVGTALLIAVVHGHTDVADVLLQGGANVGDVDEIGTSALGLAAFSGHMEIVNLLLECGAEVNLSNAYAETPLMMATQSGGTAIVQRLLQEPHIDIDAVNIAGISALMVAAIHGQAAIVDLLVQAGADIDAVAGNGFCALQMAQANGHDDIVHALMLAHLPGEAAGVDTVSSASGGGPVAWGAADAMEGLSADEECAALAQLSVCFQENAGSDPAQMSAMVSLGAGERSADATQSLESHVEYGYGWGGEDESEGEIEGFVPLQLLGNCMGGDTHPFPG